MTKTEYNKVKTKVKPLDEANEMMDKHIQPVAKGRVKKSGVGKWLGNVFFGEEGFRGWSGHMFYEVVVPSIQNGLADMATTAIQRAAMTIHKVMPNAIAKHLTMSKKSFSIQDKMRKKYLT